MTYLVERLVELQRHLDHLRELEPRVSGREALAQDLSLHNDVLFSLLMVCQLVIDLSGEVASRAGRRFEDYTEAVRQLSADARFPAALVRSLERLPGFRNVLLHEYAVLDLDRVIEALHDLEPIGEFLRILRDAEAHAD